MNNKANVTIDGFGLGSLFFNYFIVASFIVAQHFNIEKTHYIFEYSFFVIITALIVWISFIFIGNWINKLKNK